MAEGKLEFYCGILGSGKTSFAFERALVHLLKGGTVVTNIKFFVDVIDKWFRYDHGLEFDPARLIYVEDGPEVWKSAVMGTDELETMLLVDEAHVEHNARAWDKTTSESVLFNTMTRKLKVHLIYITQDMNNVDKQFRRMAQVIWYCRNAKQYGWGPFKWPFNLFFRVPYFCGPGINPTAGSPEICLRPISWGMFDTHALVGRAAETFSILSTAKTSPLRRLKRPAKPIKWHIWIPLLAAATLAFS